MTPNMALVCTGGCVLFGFLSLSSLVLSQNLSIPYPRNARRRKNGAEGGTRTRTGFPTTTLPFFHTEIAVCLQEVCSLFGFR